MASVETILACALRSRRSYSVLRRAITSDLAVADPWLLDIMRFAGEHVDRYGTMPKQGDVDLWIDTQPEPRRDPLRTKWRSLARQDLTGFTEENLADTAAEVLREAAAKVAVRRMTNNPTPDTVRTLAEELQNIRPVHMDGLVDMADVDLHLVPTREETRRIESGIEKLDAILGGGFERELVFLMAGTGVGKTTFLINRLAQAALCGATCLHITLELSAQKTLHRYYRRIAEAHRGEFFTEPDSVMGRAKHWLRFAEGSVHVLYLPAFSATAQDVLTTAEVFKEMHGSLDVLALDYLDLLAAPSGGRGLRRHDQLGILSHEVRTICTTLDAEVITASQANREGIDASKLTLKHMAGAIAKAQAADVVLGLVQDEDDAAAMQARLGFLKMRDYPGRGAEIPVYFDMDLMTILDLDHPNARRLRAEAEERAAREESS